MADPFRFMSPEPAALISMRQTALFSMRREKRKNAKPSEFQSQSQCSAGRYEKSQMAAFNALNLDGSRRQLATINARNLDCADKGKVTARSGEATECSDDTSVPAGSSIEVTRLNGDVLHSDTLLISKQMTDLRKDTLEA